MTQRAPPLADTHCHLFAPQYEHDLTEVLARARTAGVDKILVPGLDLETSRQAVELAEEHPEVYVAVGVHPHNANSWTAAHTVSLTELARSPKVVAIGEIGLDFYRNYSPPQEQEYAFRGQLELAAALDLPVVVHIRAATEPVLDILCEWVDNVPAGVQLRKGVLHAYSGDRRGAERATAYGFFLGIAGPITYPNAPDRREITAGIALERLLVETDGPYLAPHPHRGTRNEPANVAVIADKLAGVLASETIHVAEVTSHNAELLFRWNHGSSD
jgi:TatD DNase family protein